MKRSLRKFACATVLSMSSAFIAVNAQDTTAKQVVVNPDGSYSVIEYPVGKEVMVTLLPGTAVAGSKGSARIVRSADGTKVYLDVSGAPMTASNYYVYAVDPSGTPSMLGQLPFSNGVGKAEFTTPMNQFMLVLSPTEGMSTYDPSTVVYRSDVPSGYTIIPRKTAVVSTTTTTTTTTSPMATGYEVPLLNVSAFGDSEKEVELKFGGDLKGLDAKAYIDREKGTTKVKMRFGDMKKVPMAKRFVLWTSSPDGKYTKLGQVVNTGGRDEAEIRSETALADFGLFLTVEDSDVAIPTSRVYSAFAIPKS
ncbi:MAG: hypothetical protein WKF92_14645 [Pyrinomonadaceae bacterium]